MSSLSTMLSGPNHLTTALAIKATSADIERLEQAIGKTLATLTFADYFGIQNRKAYRYDQLTDDTLKVVVDYGVPDIADYVLAVRRMRGDVVLGNIVL